MVFQDNQAWRDNIQSNSAQERTVSFTIGSSGDPTLNGVWSPDPFMFGISFTDVPLMSHHVQLFDFDPSTDTAPTITPYIWDWEQDVADLYIGVRLGVRVENGSNANWQVVFKFTGEALSSATALTSTPTGLVGDTGPLTTHASGSSHGPTIGWPVLLAGADVNNDFLTPHRYTYNQLYASAVGPGAEDSHVDAYGYNKADKSTLPYKTFSYDRGSNKTTVRVVNGSESDWNTDHYQWIEIQGDFNSQLQGDWAWAAFVPSAMLSGLLYGQPGIKVINGSNGFTQKLAIFTEQGYSGYMSPTWPRVSSGAGGWILNVPVGVYDGAPAIYGVGPNDLFQPVLLTTDPEGAWGPFNGNMFNTSGSIDLSGFTGSISAYVNLTGDLTLHPNDMPYPGLHYNGSIKVYLSVTRAASTSYTFTLGSSGLGRFAAAPGMPTSFTIDGSRFVFEFTTYGFADWQFTGYTQY